MTASRKSRPAKIAIRSRKGHLTAHVKHGMIDLDGWAAVIVIAIILASRIVRAIIVATYRLGRWLAPIVARQTGRLYRWAIAQRSLMP